MAAEIKRDPDLEWIDYVRPVGLVVAPVLLKELGLAPSRQTQADTAVIAAQIGEDSSEPGFNHPWVFFEEGLGWEARHVAGSPNGPKLPDAHDNQYVLPASLHGDLAADRGRRANATRRWPLGGIG
jgi:hypothetical protein